MQRRTLVGAVALAAVAGAGIPSPAVHARHVLGLVTTDPGLVDPEGARARMREAFLAHLSSPAVNLQEWAWRRAAALTGADNVSSLLGYPQMRTLLAFGFVYYTQHRDLRLTGWDRSTPVPVTLAALESGFFPELVRQIDIRRKASPAFDALLQSGWAELEEFITEAVSLAVAAVIGWLLCVGAAIAIDVDSKKD